MKKFLAFLLLFSGFALAQGPSGGSGALPKATSEGQCLVSTAYLKWAAGACSGTASSNWNAIVPGTGTIGAGTFNVGTGSTITPTGSGVINANQYKGNAAPTATEFSYLSGVTSVIQTQFGARALTTTTISAGVGLSGGGDLSANRTLNLIIPTRSVIGGVFMGAACGAGNHVSDINQTTGELVCSSDTGGSMVYPVTGVPVSTGSAWGTSLTAPAGAIVGTTDTQSLTNKNLTGAGNTFPTFNQNTTGTAAGLTSQYIDWNSSSGGNSIANKPTLFVGLQNNGTDITPTAGKVNFVPGTNMSFSVTGNAITLNSSGTAGLYTAANNATFAAGNKSTSGTCTFKVNTSDQIESDCPLKIGGPLGAADLPEVAAPASPSAGTGTFWADSTDHRIHDKNSSGTIGTTVVANTLAAHNFVNAVSSAGVVSGVQPACGDLSDAGTGCSATIANYAPLVSPSFTTPTLGVASATSINKVAITAPATSATLTIANGKTLTASNTITFTATDSSSVAFGAGGTVRYTTSTVNTVVDTSTPVTVSTTLGAEFHFNQHATAATAMVYTLPTAAAGKQFCFANSYNGTAANTGTIRLSTSAAGQYIIYTDGTLSASNGYVISGGAAGDAGCVVGVDATHWMFYIQRGTWTKN